MRTIYKIINTVNDKVYIGKTSRSLQIRWSEHKNNYLNKSKDNKLYRAMRKYGVENFNIISLEDNIPNELLSLKEQEYIQQYNSYYHGYNSTFGGDGESCVDFIRVEQLFNQGLNCTQIAKQLGHTRTTISSSLKAHGYEIPSIPGNKGKGKKVLFEGVIYPSITALAKYLIQNNEDFKGKKEHAVVKGISKATTKNVSYLGYDFDSI